MRNQHEEVKGESTEEVSWSNDSPLQVQLKPCFVVRLQKKVNYDINEKDWLADNHNN